MPHGWRSGGFIPIGTGRDAADVPFSTLFGAVEMQVMNVWAESREKAAQNEGQQEGSSYRRSQV